MKLSVIIVNYNVEYFLEQCLNSVFAAMKSVSAEVIVVDNHSVDGSVTMVKQKFPSVILLDNHENLGFSKANNQALRIAKGEYCLLLNPDTLVEEDTFQKVIQFMDEHPEGGGLGVKMIDGRGNFLPESKRGLPTPGVAFSKIFGLSAVFPKSKLFGQYHLGYLDKDNIHPVDVLSGAFMLLRKSALEKTGLLDEAFFMYGEDIDLSYRITQAGFKNYYFPKTTIIHYKGESTKKSSVNYVFVFYNAMIIFARKHFSQSGAKLYSFLIYCAIYFRAGIAILSRAAKASVVPLIDFAALLSGMTGITLAYQKFEEIIIPTALLQFALPVYCLIWILVQLYSGGYDKPIRLLRTTIGATAGTAIILIIYALLSKEYQFSRLIVVIGGIWVLVYYLISRLIFHLLLAAYHIGSRKVKKFIIVGKAAESGRVADLLRQVNSGVDSIQLVSADESREDGNYIGTFTQLDQILDIYDCDEIIFCAKDVSAEKMISQMMRLEGRKADFKIAQPETSFLIGSNSIESSGDLYVLDINRVNKPANRRNKRTLDLIFAILLLCVSPLLVWMYTNKTRFFRNLSGIVFGHLSFVGYAVRDDQGYIQLPNIKRGILSPLDNISGPLHPEVSVARLNLIYSKNHSVWTDFSTICRNLKKLDR